MDRVHPMAIFAAIFYRSCFTRVAYCMDYQWCEGELALDPTGCPFPSGTLWRILRHVASHARGRQRAAICIRQRRSPAHSITHTQRRENILKRISPGSIVKDELFTTEKNDFLLFFLFLNSIIFVLENSCVYWLLSDFLCSSYLGKRDLFICISFRMMGWKRYRRDA